ncbi:dimethylhistidine N-methyltransferase [Legionella jamestowniensis]|uniref:Dimethylhistidine N-methyltransferase n=1 Tax=Legionella jamestowniensis TaxID=455 RepID=A0ABX2XSQ5_9GAMM|nr:L-histidine N(alpha)-methyltransferase [Legionella jamestowniensis]OCH97482.1 dimethylhistidine N-methyltransferase [Legionella jamestowniensis]
MSATIETLQCSQNKPASYKEFMRDVCAGLSRKNKQLSSKYFYDAAGSRLFNQITHHPDYYLTGCELEILKRHKKEFSVLLKDEEFNLVEFGPGEGLKTTLLINQFLKDNLSFTYFAVDISGKYLDSLTTKLKRKQPLLKTVVLNSDYITGMEWLSLNSNKRNFLLFLGSSIGNFDIPSAKKFLQAVRDSLHVGDYFLIGFDLRKDIDVLLRAYNDRDGLTREFNLNLLRRINKELEGNFDLDSFYHYGIYNPNTGAMESYLISLKDQIVCIGALKKSFPFKKFEPIRVESSYKYSDSQIKKLAKESGFEIIKNYSDSKKYFVNSLWRAN